MATCSQCHKAAEEFDRFCTRCGTVVGGDFGAQGRLRVASGEAVTSGVVRRRWLIGAGAAVLAVLAFWSVQRSVERARAEDEAERAATQTTLPALGDDSNPVVVSGEGPLLGEPVGMTLFVGSNEGITEIDLDTGTPTTLDLVGVPLAFTDNWLVAYDMRESSVTALNLVEGTVTRLEDNVVPTTNFELFGTAVSGASAEPGTVWLYSLNTGFNGRWQRIDLADGEVLEVVNDASWPNFSPFAPVLAGSAGGGVFQRRDGRYLQVHDGVLIAAAPTVALILSCDGPLDCRLNWYDTDGWNELDRPLPETGVGPGALLSTNGRLLATGSAGTTFISSQRGANSVGRRVEIFDVEQGHSLMVPTDVNSFALAPDGTLVAAAAASDLLIYVLGEDEPRRLDVAPDLPSATQGLLLAERGER